MINKEVTIRQLSKESLPTEENLIRMAELIYYTDPYIYPAMFGNLERAKIIIPEMIKQDDIMFGFSHCIVAELGGIVVGTLLWINGNIIWTPDLLRGIAAKKNVEISPYLDYVAKEYTGMYSIKRENTLSFYNMCVTPQYRRSGIGKQLFQKVLDTYPNYLMKLSVLDGNVPAMNLYCSVGFEVVAKYKGFSVEEEKPISVLMERYCNGN